MPIVLNTDSIAKYLWIGRNDKDWYKGCRQVFVDIFGEEEIELVCSLFAATSINSSLKSNIQLFRKAYYEIKNDLPVGNYLPVMKQQIVSIREGGDLSGRKIRSFKNAMKGDQQAVVVDIWLLRAFMQDIKHNRKVKGTDQVVLRSGGATDRQYTAIETYIREQSAGMGLHPCEMSAMIWAGVRINQGGDRQTRYESILRHSFNNLFSVV